MQCARGWALAALVFLAAFAGPATSLVAAAPPTQVDSCTTINESGTYVLSGDITNGTSARCLEIQANDVVLDGQGHTVAAGEVAAVAVNASGPLANVTVQDVRVTGADEGIEVDNTVDARILDVFAEGNRVGVGLHETRTAQVQDITATRNELAGVQVRDGTETLVENVTTSENVLTESGDPAGIALIGTDDATIRDSDIADEYDGISLTDSDRTLVVGNSIQSSSNGIAVVDGSTGNELRENTLQRSRIILHVRDDATPIADNVIADNTLVRGAISGGSLAHNLTVRDNELEDGPGISVAGRNSTISGNQVRSPGGGGIDVGGTDTTVRSNRVTGADAAGIHVRAGGNGVQLSRNVLVENDGHGVAIGGINQPAVTDVLLRHTYVRDNGGQSFHATGDSTATAQNFTLATATVDFGARNAAFGPLSDPPAPPEGKYGVDQYLNTSETMSNAFLDLRFYYDEAETSEFEESTLRIYRHAGEWQGVESEVDAEENTVAGTLLTVGGAVGVMGGEPTPTPTVTATATETTGATPTATATESGPVINPTVRPGWTPTPSPTPSETPTPTETPTATATPTTQPGFGVLAALIALLSLVGAVIRRR